MNLTEKKEAETPSSDTTLEGDPARCWCHLHDNPIAFKSIEDLSTHMKKAHGTWGDK
jgi:hypothetical protein